MLRWCRTRYERMLARVTRHPWPVMAAALLLTALGAAAAAGFGVNFIPELKEGHLIVHMSAAPGTSIEESMRLGSRVSSALHELTAVRAVAQRIGRADKSDDILGSHYSEFDVDLTVSEYDIVHFLVSNVGNYETYRAIYDVQYYEGFVAGQGDQGFRTNVRSSIKRIRRKFCKVDATFAEIQNSPSRGYRWRGLTRSH